VNLAKILKVVSSFPCMVNKETNEELCNPITKEELFLLLKYFRKDRSREQDGWSVEFYIEFFYLLGTNLLQVLEEVRTSSRMIGSLNVVDFSTS